MLLAAAVLGLSALLWWRGIAWAAEFGSIAAFVLALCLALARPIRRWLRLPGASSLTPGEAADRLAAALRSLWVEDERRWRVNDPYSMPVRCRIRQSSRGRQGGSFTSSNTGAYAEPQVPAPLAAEFGDIAEAFQTLPSRRMVIVGSAGAGKTVMATRLAIYLASSSARSPGGMLPVVLPAVNWNADERLDDWVARELSLRWRWLGERPRNGAEGSLADALARGLVIPVIDGLDEMPGHLHVRAIEQVNAWGSDKPLVLTSRPDAYDNATAAAREISQAARVEILPLSIEESKAYILEATSGSSSRWVILFRDLKPGTPLSAALTVPLLLWLVRCIYRDAESDPGELSDPGRFSDLQAIESYLIGRLVPSVYDPKTGLSRFRWTPGQAERWLAFLAARPGDIDAHDLRWWRLPLTARKWRPVAFAVCGALLFSAAWLLSAWALRRLGGWRHGAESRSVLSTGLLGRHIIHAANYLHLQPDARGFRTAIDAFPAFIHWNSLAALELWVVLGACAGLVNGRSLYVRPPRQFGLPVHRLRAIAAMLIWPTFLTGMAYLLLIGFQRSLPVLRETRFGSVLFHAHTAGLLIAVVFAWSFADFASWLAKPADVAGSLNAAQVLRLDQMALLGRFLLRLPVRTVVAWLLLGPVLALAYAAFSVTRLLASFVLGGNLTASSEYASARLWLAASRRLPWRVMAFLADAHAIGVLRRTGATYQFRHGLLEQQLSARYPYAARRVALLAVRHAGWLVRFLEDRSFKWRWWSSASDRHWSEPLWEHRFAETARTAGQNLGPPADGPHRAVPGMFQHFGGTGGDHGWVICALWRERPTLVAKPAWDALRQACVKPDADPTATLGFPVPAPGLRWYLASDRVVRADDDRITLRGGRWGPGNLVRDPQARTWRWEPEPYVDHLGTKEWLPCGPPAPQFRLRAEVSIRFARPGLTAAPEALDRAARQIASSNLAEIAAGPWPGPGQDAPAEPWGRGPDQASSPGRGSLTRTVFAANGRPAHVVEVKWAISRATDSTTFTAAAELRIERQSSGDDDLPGLTAPHTGKPEPRMPLEDLLEFLTAAWHAAGGLIPGAVLGNVTELPLAGPPHVDMIVSAATPADLLFRRASCQNLSGSGISALTAALLREHLAGLRRGRLMYFIDLTPFRPASRPPPLTEMSARITAPLSISSEDRQELVRQALAYMITLVSFKPSQKLTTSEPQWNDARKAVFSRSFEAPIWSIDSQLKQPEGRH